MLNKHIYLSKENIQCQKLKLLVHCFLLRILSFFQRNASCNIGISKGRVALFAPNRHIQQSEKHMCPTTENLLGQKLKHQHIVYLLQLNLFQKGIFPKQQNFQGDARVILFKEAYLSELTSPMYLSKKTIQVRSGSSQHIVSFGEFSQLEIGIFLQMIVFTGKKGSFCNQ